MVMVLDASVVVKWFVPEPLSAMAEAVLEEYSDFVAPELLRIEVSSGITRKVRNRELSASIAYEKLHDWKKFLAANKIELIPSEELLEDAEKLSIELRHPLKDCFYLAAANQYKLPLFTADQVFIDAIGKRFPNVKHLASFKASH